MMSFNREVLRLAFPNIISNVTIPLLGLIDLAIVGHMENAIVLIGALALGGMIFSFIYMTLSFLRSSTAGLTAQAFGAKHISEQQAHLQRALLIAVSLSAVLILLQVPIEWLSFKLIDGSAELEQTASIYFRIRIWAAPATLMLYVFTGWFIGMQDSKTPMFIAIAGNILNIGINFLLIVGFGMQIEGVAWATVFSQYFSLILALVWLRYRYGKFRLIQLNGFGQGQWGKMLELLQMNSDLFIRSVVLILVLSFFTTASAQDSPEILAVNSMLFQFFLFFSFFMDGFAYAAESLTGRFLGMGQMNMVKKTVTHVMWWGLILSLPFILIYIFAYDLLLAGLTNELGLIQLAHEYQIWVCLIPILSFVPFLWDGVYIGATATRPIRNAILIAGILVFLPAYYLSRGFWSNHGLWFSFSLFMLVRGFLMSYWHPASIRKSLLRIRQNKAQ